MRKRSSKGGGAQRSIQVHLMVNEEEAAMIRAAARKRNQTVSLTIIEAVKLLEGSLYVEEEEHDSPTVQALREIEYQLRRIGRNVNQIAHNANREMNANIFKRGRLLRNAEQVAGEQSERLRGAVPWLEDADIPADWDQANRFRMRTTKAIYDHDMQPRTRLVAELERRLEQAERAESERPSPEQVKALALRMAEQRAQAENPTQDTKRPAPSGDEPLDLSEPEDWGEASPFESRQAPRTKADLLNEIRQRTDRLTGQREAEQRQIDPWSAQPPQRRGHGR